MNRTVDLSVLISKSNDELRELKASLFRELVHRNELDYLVPLEQKLFDLLKEDPSVKMNCRKIIEKL